MEPNKENTIYTYAFLGVLLFIAAIVCATVSLGNVLAMQLPYILAVFVPGITGSLLLASAIKMDKYRMRKA